MSLSLDDLQDQLRPWVAHNFGSRPAWHPLLGVMEELGELSHAHLKQTQGIRGAQENHENAAKDAIGDIMVYLADYANARGWRLSSILEDVWEEVKKRDWKENKDTGAAYGSLVKP